MQKQEQKKGQGKKQAYEAPKSTELGSVQQLTQVSKGGNCGSNVSFKQLA